MIYKDPICSNCKFRRYDKPGAFCEAFPDGDGIPDEILYGGNDHSKPIEGQKNEIVFKPKEDVKE